MSPKVCRCDMVRGGQNASKVAWQSAGMGTLSLEQLKVMSAIEDCRTAALGGHVARCENEVCGFTSIAYNSCLMGTFSNGELAAT